MYNKAFISGVADLLILAILFRSDSYGYEITQTIKQYSEEKLVLSPNTVYACIYKLEDKGYISEYSKLVGRKRTRVYYHLEEAGVKHYLSSLQEYRTITENVFHILDALEEHKDE